MKLVTVQKYARSVSITFQRRTLIDVWKMSMKNKSKETNHHSIENILLTADEKNKLNEIREHKKKSKKND